MKEKRKPIAGKEEDLTAEWHQDSFVVIANEVHIFLKSENPQNLYKFTEFTAKD